MRRLALAALLVTASGACASEDPFPGYIKASAEMRADVVRAIETYYDKRREAAEGRDTSTLFLAYPELATDANRQAGVNADVFLQERMRISEMKQITVEPEHYEPIRVLVNGVSALAFVHGLETWHYERGSPGMGEFLTRIDLRRSAGVWTITRTDEQQLGEAPLRTPGP